MYGRVTYVRLGAADVSERRERNEQRLRDLLEQLRNLGLEPILLSSADPERVLQSFSEWTEQRLAQRGRGW